MNEKNNFSFCVTTMSLTILVVLTVTIFSTLTLNMNHTAIVHQQEQPIINDPNLQAEIFVEGLSFPTSMAFLNIVIIYKCHAGRK